MNEVKTPFGRVLVVGGSSMLGRYTVRELINNTAVCTPDQVHIYDNKSATQVAETCRDLGLPSSNYHQGEFTNDKRLGNVLSEFKPTVVFDLVSPPMFLYELAYYMRINVDARSCALKMARDAGVKAYVYNSTAGVIHDSYSDLPGADETAPLLFMPQQREPYSHSKAVAETMVLQFNREQSSSGHSMRTAAARLCSPFGDGDTEVTDVIVQNARAGKSRFQIGDNKNLTDWTFAENGVRGYLLIAQALLKAHDAPNRIPEDERVDGEAFFLTNGEPTPFWTFTRSLGAAAGYPVRAEDVKVLPRSLAMIMAIISECIAWVMSLGSKPAAFTRHGVRYSTITRYHSIDKARKRLHYEPFVSLQEGTVKATASYRGRHS